MSVTMRASGVEVTSAVERVAREGDLSVLANPAGRFPNYKDVDVADGGDY